MLILEIAAGILIAKLIWAILKAINAGCMAYLEFKQQEKEEKTTTILSYVSSLNDPKQKK